MRVNDDILNVASVRTLVKASDDDFVEVAVRILGSSQALIVSAPDGTPSRFTIPAAGIVRRESAPDAISWNASAPG